MIQAIPAVQVVTVNVRVDMQKLMNDGIIYFVDHQGVREVTSGPINFNLSGLQDQVTSFDIKTTSRKLEHGAYYRAKMAEEGKIRVEEIFLTPKDHM